MFKNNINEINCMIPGIRNIPSVGTRPLRGGDKFIKMQMDINSTAKPQEPGALQPSQHNLTIDIHGTNNSDQTRANTVEPSRQGGQIPVTSSRMIGWAYDKGHRNSMADSAAVKPSNLYNPITNPIPSLQQNPYLRRNISIQQSPINFSAQTPQAARGQNIMANAGASILDHSQ